MADIVTAQETLTNLETELTKGQEEVAAIVSALKKSNVESYIVKQLVDRISHQDGVVLRLRILANESIIKSITLHKSNTALKSVLDLKRAGNQKKDDAVVSFNTTQVALDEEWNVLRPPPIAFTPSPPKPFLTSPYSMNQLPSNLTKRQAQITTTRPPPPPPKPTRKITPYNVDQWNRKLADLAKYYKTHGTTDIPLDDDSPHVELARWTRRQRREYQLFRKNEPSHLNPERIAALEALRFAWVAKRQPNRKRWMQRYEELLRYKAENGHCDVPSHTKDERYKKLSVWVTQQRTYHRFLRQGKPTMIYADRIKMLDEVGFNWSVAPPQVDWDVRWNQLVEYRENHGHTNVPQKCTRIPGLGEWVLSQRRLYRHHLAGERKMDPEKISKLNQIGFQWSLRNRRSSSGAGKKKDGNTLALTSEEQPNKATTATTTTTTTTTTISKNSLPSHKPRDNDDERNNYSKEETTLMTEDAAAKAALDRKRSSSSSIPLNMPLIPLPSHPFPPPYGANNESSSEMRQTASFLAHIFENNSAVAAASANAKERIL